MSFMLVMGLMHVNFGTILTFAYLGVIVFSL